MTDVEGLAQTVKALACQVGFARAGIARAESVPGKEVFGDWVAAGCHGQMAYLARDIEKRFHPRRLVPGARSVICLASAYLACGPSDQASVETGAPARAFVARYARGRDYHKVLKKRCRQLMDSIREVAGDFEGRAFVDSAPLAERGLAAAAGLGWIARNGCLIVPGLGSYVVLAEIVCNVPLEPDAPLEESCQDCDACLRACPTGACLDGSLVDARRCLSYLSIEHRGAVPAEFRRVWGLRVFGCDECQEACPHNRDVPAGDAELTSLGSDATGMQHRSLHGRELRQLLTWQESDWDVATRGCATRRAGYDTFLRNLVLAAAASGQIDLIEPLRDLRRRRKDLAESIDWALEQLGPGR